MTGQSRRHASAVEHLQKLRNNRHRLRGSEQKVAEFMPHYPQAFTHFRIVDLAA